LKAPAKNVGKRQRCPVCQWAVQVPSQSRRKSFEEYAFDENTAPVVDTGPEIAFECPVCHTRLTAPKDQIGKQVACPDCRTPMAVPAKPGARSRTQPTPQEAYAVCEDCDPSSPPAPQPEYMPIFCGRCGTLMQVTTDQVGSEVTCPDCSAVQVVELPRLHARHRIAPTTDASYEVHLESGQPPPESVANREHVGFVCRCGTRLHALVSEVGQQLTCPTCGRSVTVPPPKRKRPKPDPTKEVKGQYDTVAPTAEESQSPAVHRPPMWYSGRFTRALDEHGRLPPETPPPRWPLLSGVFTFPWRHGTWEKWLSLSVAATLIGGMGLFGWSLGRGIGLGAGIGATGPAVLSMLFMVLAGTLACGWTGVLFINLLTILGDTAAGADDVGDWPDPTAFLDWAGKTFFVTDSLAVSVLAGKGVSWLLDRVEQPGIYAMVGLPLVLFPLVLLSMLEMNSPLVPLSTTVCRSLVDHWRAWIGFYLETILLAAAIGGILIAALLPQSGLVGIPLLILLVFALVAALMIYFRLLGRLAWCYSAH